MTTFERASFSPDQVAAPQLNAEAPRCLSRVPDYAAYRTIPTGVEQYSAAATLAGFDQVLGSRITKLLLTVDAETALHVGAQVFADHAREDKRVPSKDLQAGLMVNVVKEMAQATASHAAKHFQFAEDVMRRCSLDPGFKLTLKEELFDKKGLASPFIIQVNEG